jgi:DNA polymerase-3 subunit epsilon
LTGQDLRQQFERRPYTRFEEKAMYRHVTIEFAVIALFLALILILNLLQATAAGEFLATLGWWDDALLALAALFLLWDAHARLRGHFDGLHALRATLGALRSLVGEASAANLLSRDQALEAGTEVVELNRDLSELFEHQREMRLAPDSRLTAVLTSVDEALVVVTDQGQVSLVNYMAKALLGADKVRVGTSVFAALDRPSLLSAMNKAEQETGPLSAEIKSVDGVWLKGRVTHLRDHGGAVLSFDGGIAEHRPELEHDLTLHDRPPGFAALTMETPLNDLPVTVLDCETTGLDVKEDRIVSLAAVRVHGYRIYRSAVLDAIINPERPIPRKSTGIHGITDAMVAGAPAFDGIRESFETLAQGTVFVGYNLPFDLAMLRREYELVDCPWDPPTFLDVLRLIVVLEPKLQGYGLEKVAAFLGVDIHGRHTALGDTLVTAEVYRRLVARLEESGVSTLADALALSERATAIIRKQAESGW